MTRNVLTPTLNGVITACCWTPYCSGVTFRDWESTVTLGKYCYIAKVLLHWESTVTLGKYCYIGKVLLHWESTVTLGKYCYTGKVLLHDNETGKYSFDNL